MVVADCVEDVIDVALTEVAVCDVIDSRVAVVLDPVMDVAEMLVAVRLVLDSVFEIVLVRHHLQCIRMLLKIVLKNQM